MVQWLHAPLWHIAPSKTSSITLARRQFDRYDVPQQGLCAAVRGYLLNSSGEKSYPLTCLERLNNIKTGQLIPSVLAPQVNLILASYEGSRKRLVFKMQRLLEISATRAAWLCYKRLSPFQA